MLKLSSRYTTAARVVATSALLTVLASCGSSSREIVDVPNSLVVTDLNGDGYPDIAVAVAQIDATGLTTKPGFVGVALNLSATSADAGTFKSAVDYTTATAPPSGIAVGDVMGTGGHDLVVASNAAHSLSLLTETSPTSAVYNAAKTISFSGDPNLLTLADMNGDGALDIVVADGTGYVQVLLQDPNNRGSFPNVIKLLVPTRAVSVTVADLNGDGLPDIVVTSFDSTGSNGAVQVFLQNPGATSSTVSFQTVQTVATGCEPNQAQVADLTGTGTALKSILVACQGLGTDAVGTAGLMVIPQTSAGVFGTPVMYSTASALGGMSIAVGDINGDGLPDVVMSTIYPSGYGTISVMPQDSTTPGTFDTGTSYTALGQPSRIVLADVEHRGLLDIVVSDATTAGVLLNTATSPGSFAAEYQVGY